MKHSIRLPILLLALGSTLLLVLSAAGSPLTFTGMPVSIQVDRVAFSGDEETWLAFDVIPEEALTIGYQVGIASASSCLFKQLESGETMVLRDRSTDASDAPGIPGLAPAGEPLIRIKEATGEGDRVSDCTPMPDAQSIPDPGADEAEVHFGKVFRTALQRGKPERLEALIRHPDGEGPIIPEGSPDKRLFIRIWEEGSGESILVPMGGSYNATPDRASDDALVAVFQNTTVLLVGMQASGQAVNSGAKGNQREEWKGPIVLPALWLFTRLKRSKLLDHRTRRAIHDLIEGNPGIRFSELRERSRFASGVLTHHLRILEEHDLIVSKRRGRHRYLFTRAIPGQPEDPLTDRQKEILTMLSRCPGTQNEIAQSLGISQQAVSYHLGKLVEEGRISRRRGHRGVWVYQAA